MKKDETYYLNYIDECVNKITAVYEKSIQKFGMGRQSLDKFNERYQRYLDHPSGDLESFFANEQLTAESIYESFQTKKHLMDQRLEKTAKFKADFEALAQDYSARISHYPLSDWLPEDEEIDQLVTFISQLYQGHWDNLESIIRKKYKIGTGSPLDEIVISIADFSTRRDGEIPFILHGLKNAYEKTAPKTEIERFKKTVIKESAVILNKISHLLGIELEDNYFFTPDDLNYISELKKEIDLAIYNFRIGAFSPHSHL